MNACLRLLPIAFVLWAIPCGAIPGGAQSTTPSASKWSAERLYNLANAYARAGKPGMAVLNYERARLLAPGDADIEANLLLVRRSAGLPIPARGAWSRAVAELSPLAASWIGLAGLLLIEAAALAGQMRAGHRRWRRIAALAGIALIAVTGANAAAIWPRLHEAIVITESAPVRISPAPMADALFGLKEAAAVRIAGEHEGFVLVHSSGGRTGWIWHADLVPVVPSSCAQRRHSDFTACPPN